MTKKDDASQKLDNRGQLKDIEQLIQLDLNVLEIALKIGWYNLKIGCLF